MQASNVKWNVNIKASAKAGLYSVTSAEYWSQTMVSAGVDLGPGGDAKMRDALGDLRASTYKDRLEFLSEDVVDEEVPWRSLKGMVALLVKKAIRDASQPGPSRVS
jgi:hypothetical protein